MIILSFNPLSPSIHIQILQTDLHTFPFRISLENLIKHQGIFSFVIIFYILKTLSFDNVWTLLGENCCWSLLGLKARLMVRPGVWTRGLLFGRPAGSLSTELTGLWVHVIVLKSNLVIEKKPQNSPYWSFTAFASLSSKHLSETEVPRLPS